MRTYKKTKRSWDSFLILLAMLLFFGKNLKAQEMREFPKNWSIDQILDTINAKNSGLKQFMNKTKASNQQADAVKGWPAPNVGVGLSEFPYNSPSAKGMSPRKMPMIRIQQKFPNFSRQKKLNTYYKSYSSLNENDRETMRNLLFSQAKKIYTRAYIAEKKLRVLNQQEKQIMLLLKIAEGRLQYGKSDLPNIYKLRAKLSDLKSRRIKIKSTIDQSTTVLNSLMNRPIHLPLHIDTTTNLVTRYTTMLKVDSNYIKKHRSDIARIINEIKTGRLQQEVVHSQNTPTFGITWDNMRMSGGMYMYSIMATISIPIAPWSSKNYKNQSQAIDFRIQAKKNQLENKIQMTLGAIEKLKIQIKTARRDLKIFKAEVIPAYQKTFQANLNAFSENTGSIYETLAAWEDLTRKEFEFYNKLSDLIMTQIELETKIQQY